MKLLKSFIVLITFICLSGAAQPDSTSQKKATEDSTPQKLIITVDNSKAITDVTPQKRTTWTSIKELFK